MDPVQGVALESRAALFDIERPGNFFVDVEQMLFFCECPCGCGGHMALPIHREGEPKQRPNDWTWNGNRSVPTLQPSIRDLNGCRFHGHVTNGLWTFQPDSGVKA